MAVSKIKTREIELKKQIILEEAAKLIDKVGFKNAKMEDIAKKVVFSKA
jgi:AcrR family transcriptional regulator